MVPSKHLILKVAADLVFWLFYFSGWTIIMVYFFTHLLEYSTR